MTMKYEPPPPSGIEWLPDYPENVVPITPNAAPRGKESAGEARAASSRAIAASAFSLPAASQVPRRQWLYARRLIRGQVAATIAPGGVGKSSLTIVDALAMASGRDLLDTGPAKPLRVWMWNGEDPMDELQRRFVAAAQHYRVSNADIGDRLKVDSGRDMPIILASQGKAGVIVNEEAVAAIETTIRENRIDVVIVDPFVSTHRVPENDNGAIDLVVKTWASIAGRTGCAVELVHHSRKTGGEEVTVEDARGGSALIGAVRSARVLNVMTEAQAAKAGVVNRRLYFSADNGKANLAPPSGERRWYSLASVLLDNGMTEDDGDLVGVVTPWQWPDALDNITVDDFSEVRAKVASGEWREAVQSENWVGRAVAEVMGWSIHDPSDKAKIRALLATWFKSGALVVIQKEDAHRKFRAFVEVAS